MAIDIEINGSMEEAARYVSFAPAPCRIRCTGLAGTARVTLRSETLVDSGGAVVFYPSPDGAAQETLELSLPADDGWVEFWVGGKWEHSSIEDRDCEIRAQIGSQEEAVALMVRVRKNANNLLPGERDRFIHAFARLNDRGHGKFADFRAMHVDAALFEAHGGPQFLPWHRAYLLDLERELQAIDPSVSLHYWRWDEPAPNLFTEDFIGVSGFAGRVAFAPGNPLGGWVTDDIPGIIRVPLFDTVNEPGSRPGRVPIGEAATLALDDEFAGFRSLMEGNPHGAAHMCFRGFISAIHTAAKDPLFFMLHSNVDRLWALWQWFHDRTDRTDAAAYEDGTRLGSRRPDTMWPWNGDTSSPRPDFAPGGPLADTTTVTVPGPEPKVEAMIDYQGRTRPAERLGFGYDTVPFERT